MARLNYDSTMAAAIATGNWSPIIFCSLAFRSETVYVWSGFGNLSWNGQTWVGVGSIGKIALGGDQGGGVSAQGATVGVSGIDGVLLGEILTDLLPNGAAGLWLGAFINGAIAGTPYQIFGGYLGQSEIIPGAPTPDQPDAVNLFTLSLSLENALKQLNRPTKRRFTAADQRMYYPDDSGFNYVEVQNDVAEVWG